MVIFTHIAGELKKNLESSDSSTLSLSTIVSSRCMGNSLRHSFRRSGSMESKKVVLGQVEMSDSSTHSLTLSTVASHMGNSLRNSFRRMRSMESKKGNLRHHRDSFVLNQGQNDEFVPRGCCASIASSKRPMLC